MPFLVLGNKIDAPGAVSEEELRQSLGLFQTTGKGSVPLKDVRPIELFMCSVVMRQGYGDGFRWLSNYVSNQTSVRRCYDDANLDATDRSNNDATSRYYEHIVCGPKSYRAHFHVA